MRMAVAPGLLPRLLVVALVAAVPHLLAGQTAATRSGDASANQTCRLVIHIDGFRNPKGNAGTAVFAGPEGWPEDKNKSVQAGPAPIHADGDKPTATQVWQLPAGDYGVVVFHDENANGKFDKGLFGIPKEGFGFANNPAVGLVPPAWKLALVHVACPETATSIHLIYK